MHLMLQATWARCSEELELTRLRDRYFQMRGSKQRRSTNANGNTGRLSK